MSKRFRNKVCVYCGGVATTPDHVVARAFFPESLRDNLPKVPACSPCNKAKSDLEHYLATVLPRGSDHPAALALRSDLDRRLSNNQRLARELNSGMRQLPEGWALIPLRTDPIERYMALVARGLLFHHFGAVLSLDFVAVGSGMLTCGPAAFEEMRQRFGESVHHVSCSFADGALTYTGFAAIEDVRHSGWRLCLYGGVAMGSRLHRPEPQAYEFMALTLPASQNDR